MESHLSRFDELLRTALADGTFGKLTLGKPRVPDSDLRNVHVRPVRLKTGPQFSFVYRHRTRDVTKNHPTDSAAREISRLLADTFFDAHLFTTTRQVQLELQPDGTARLRTKTVQAGTQPESHDRIRQHPLDPQLPWLRALGVTNERGQPREGMAAKYRQIQKFTELIDHLSAEADLPTDRPWRIADMGCGKGYLTFAVATLLGPKAKVQGIERRADLVDLTNRIARECHCSNLEFTVGDIGTTTPAGIDMLIALHACDTATDDALAAGIASGAALLVVSPCCQKELRPQLTAPPVLADALQHGIFQERQAEFVTDALRAQLLETAGYRTKVFEFVSTEHTAKNLMIAAIRTGRPPDPAQAERLRDFARFYGIKHQQLARHLNFNLEA